MFDVTKLKAIADDKLYVAKVTISVFDRVENAEGKGENADYQHFLPFPQCFSRPRIVKSQDRVVKSLNCKIDFSWLHLR